MNKKIVKLAVIRTTGTDQCPFGLSIPFGCKYAGDHIDKMAPLNIIGADASDEEKTKIVKSNKKFLLWKLSDAEKPHKCRYADVIMESKEAVNCNYNDTAPGVSQMSFIGSPFYSRVMQNIALDGLYSYPIGYYADYNISRNLYYGIYSLQGSGNPELIRVANNSKDTPNGACILFYCPDDSSVLLLKRAKSVNQPGTWGLPGGHLEKGEFPAQGAIRELYEEMGFVPNISDIISSHHIEMDKKANCVIFIVKINKETKFNWDKIIKLNEEHDEFKWFSMVSLPQNLHTVADFVLNNSANINE